MNAHDHKPKSEKVQHVSFEVLPFRHAKLAAERQQIVDFANAVFQHCHDIGGWITLRSFDHTNDKCVLVEWVKFGKGMVDAYESAATKTANLNPAAVFAPPACLFKSGGKGKATVSNVAAGPVLSVELDENPNDSRTQLEALLGKATLVVASGGVWVGTDGITQDKLHLYWRLKTPATTEADLFGLTRARKLATALVSADTTNNPISHPIRCPGSWHTKTTTPRLCKIIGGARAHEIELDDALSKLEVAAGSILDDRRSRHGTVERQGFKTQRAWSDDTLMEVAEKLPNPGWTWDEWNKVGMTIYDASHGSSGGLEAFHALSEKSDKYDPFVTDERWGHYNDYPPHDLAGNSLTYRMQQAVDPLWLPTWPRADNSEAVELFALAGDDGPFDLFANGDPAQLANLPANAVPAMLERLIRSDARRKGAPEAFAAISVITALGAAIGAGVTIQPKQKDDSFVVAANLWSVIVADPGSAKSPVIDAAVQPLKKVDATWIRHDQITHDLWVSETKSRKKDSPPPKPEPRIRRAIVDDVTSEKQIRIFRDNPRGVLRAPDELSGLLGGFGQYKKGGGADREQFLRSFDGKSITADRVGGGTIVAEKAVLSVLAGTQPDRMHDLVKNLGADGLLQRFIIVSHDGQDREALDEEPDRAATQWYDEVVQQLTAAPYGLSSVVRMDAGAGEVFAWAGRQIDLLKFIPDTPTQLKGHYAKWRKILPSLVLIVHVARKMEDGGGFDPSELIEVETVRMATRLGNFLLEHARHFYKTYFGTDEGTSEARWIAEHLLTRPDLKVVTRKHLYDVRKVYRGPDGQRRATAAMAELANLGWCWESEWEANGPKSWCVDTRIHERFADMAERVKQDRQDKRRKIIAAGSAQSQLRNGLVLPVMPTEGIFG